MWRGGSGKRNGGLCNDVKIAIQVAITTRGALKISLFPTRGSRGSERCKRSFSSFHSHFIFLSVSLILHYDIGSFSDHSFKTQGLDLMSEEQMAEDHIITCDFDLCHTSINESDSFFELLNYTSAVEL